MNSRYVKYLAIAASVVWGVAPVVAQPQLVDLGVATGYAINNSGQVVLSTGIYSNGATTPLPALTGQTAPATGAAINATGQVAGSAPTTMPNPTGGNFDFTVPVEFSGGTLTILQPPIEYATNISSEAYATGINSSAEIVGYSISPDLGSANLFQGYIYTGFIYANGKLGSLPIMPASINDSGKMTGVTSTGDINERDAFIYDYATGTLTDLGRGAGSAINNAGQVTGTLDEVTVTPGGSDTITGSYAFLNNNGTTTKLGTLPGANDAGGAAINSTGQVVGGSGGHAFFYNGAMNDLNSLVSATDPLKPYVTLQNAVGINDSMLILVNGVDSRTPNVTHAYLYQGPLFQIAPGSLNFTQNVGGTSPGLSVTVTNTGIAAIPFGLPYVDGDFSVRADSCGTSAGANYQVPLSGVAPITAQISASSSAATVGQPLTLSWTASVGSTCAAGSYSTNASRTASNPPFTGTVSVSGKQTLTEIVNGSVTYTLNCTAPGVAAMSVSASVVWSWPTVTAALSASPTTITAGKSTTLTWKSSNATSCTATGGGPDDSWAGTKATSGSQTVTEPFALDTSSVTLTFGITCNSSASGLSDKASASVTESQAAASSGGGPTSTGSGGGGGSLSPLSLAFLAGIFALRRHRVRIVSHNGPRLLHAAFDGHGPPSPRDRADSKV